MKLPWSVDQVEGTAAVLHRESAALLASPSRPRRLVRILSPTDRAVVLGSTQPEWHVDAVRAAAAGVSVVRRHSGGAAVLVGPGELVWVDIVLPSDDPLWDRDVGRAAWWLGQAWAGALTEVGLLAGEVWRGGFGRPPWSDRVCFAGRGAGEVLVGGTKVVGMCQRRTRAGALFQCAVPVIWEPSVLLGVLAMEQAEREAGREALAGVAFGVGAGVASRLVPALVDHLR